MVMTELTGNPRHDQLIMLITERGYMNIEELAQLLNVSTQTVRRDIRKLSELGLVSRHHGGAGRASSVMNTAFEQRELSYTNEKGLIADRISHYLPDNCTLFITIGTTVEHIARALELRKNLRIITNSLRVANILYKYRNIEVIVPGGIISPHNGGITGPEVVNFIKGFRADYTITSMGAIETDGTILDFNVNEAAVAKAMIAHSHQLLLAADHSKFNASAAVEIGKVSQASALFTDQSPSLSMVNYLKHYSVELYITN